MSVILRICALLVCGYFAISMASLWGDLNADYKELESLNEQLVAEQNEVDELRTVLEAESDVPLIEKAAWERLGYIYSDEQVFIDISGD